MPGPIPTQPVVAANPYETLKNDSMANALRLGLLTTMLGAGARGTTGLLHFIQRYSGGDQVKPVKRKTVVSLPMATKMAAGEPITLDSIAKGINSTLGISAPNGPRPGVTGFAMGDRATTANDIPWRIPAVLGLGSVGAMAGWHGMDKVLDTTRTAEKESEVEAAKREYMEALRGASKQAGAEDPLDKLYTSLEKQGGLGTLAGAYLATALGTGGLTGLATYNYAREHSKEKILEKARKVRQAQLMQRGALPMAIKITPNG